MSLVLHWGNSANLNPTECIGQIGVVGVKDLVEAQDSTFFIFTILSSESKYGRVLFISPVRKLIVAKYEVWTIRVVVLFNDSVPI